MDAITKYYQVVKRLFALMLVSVAFCGLTFCQFEADLCGNLDLSPECQPAFFLAQFLGRDILTSHIFVTSAGIEAYAVEQSSGALTQVSGSPFGSGCVSRAIIGPSQKRIFYNDNSTLRSIDIQNPDTPQATALAESGISNNEMIFSENGNYLLASTSSSITSWQYDAFADTITQVSGSPFGSGCMRAYQQVGNYLIIGQNTPLGTNELLTYTFNPDDGTLALHSTGIDKRINYSVRHPVLDVIYYTNAESGMDNIYVYAVNRTTGVSTQLTGSPYALDAAALLASTLSISPDGRFLYVYSTSDDTLRVFQVNDDGSLNILATHSLALGVSINNILVDSTSKYLFATVVTGNEIWVFSIATDGKLTQIVGNTVSTGVNTSNWIQAYTQTIPWY